MPARIFFQNLAIYKCLLLTQAPVVLKSQFLLLCRVRYGACGKRLVFRYCVGYIRLQLFIYVLRRPRPPFLKFLPNPPAKSKETLFICGGVSLKIPVIRPIKSIIVPTQRRPQVKKYKMPVHGRRRQKRWIPPRPMRPNKHKRIAGDFFFSRITYIPLHNPTAFPSIVTRFISSLIKTIGSKAGFSGCKIILSG